MLRNVLLVLASAGTIAFTPASAQSSTGFGASSFSSVRDCSTTAQTALCNGSTSAQRTRQSQLSGGIGQELNSTFTSAAPYAGGSTSASVAFGAFGLPTVRGTVVSSASTRVGNTIYFYQSYRYDGVDEADIALLANLHIVDSSSNATDASLPGGALSFAALSIWDAADWPVFGSVEDMFNNGALFSYGCDAENGYGPRTYGQINGGLAGGEANLSLRDQSCYGEETVTMYQGDEFVIAGVVQLIANRGGFIDASHSFTVGLDEAAIGAANVAALQGGLVPASLSAVPEPATWAMLMLGFGALGAALRRRTVPVLAAA